MWEFLTAGRTSSGGALCDSAPHTMSRSLCTSTLEAPATPVESTIIYYLLLLSLSLLLFVIVFIFIICYCYYCFFLIIFIITIIIHVIIIITIVKSTSFITNQTNKTKPTSS